MQNLKIFCPSCLAIVALHVTLRRVNFFLIVFHNKTLRKVNSNPEVDFEIVQLAFLYCGIPSYMLGPVMRNVMNVMAQL